jgi:hypothetical protein
VILLTEAPIKILVQRINDPKHAHTLVYVARAGRGEANMDIVSYNRAVKALGGDPNDHKDTLTQPESQMKIDKINVLDSRGKKMFTF